MKLIKLDIEFSDKKNNLQQSLFENKVTYKFSDLTLITSNNQNSRGKTTLIRFLLYALGFSVSLTDGMKTYNYKTTLIVSHNNEDFTLIRSGEVQYINGIIFDGFKMINNAKEYTPMIYNILGLHSLNIINNLLGCFYVDQEKGWTLLNRGRVIGNNKFNITKFLMGIKQNIVLEELDNENIKLEKEIRKIKLLKHIKYYTDNYNDKDIVEVNPKIPRLEELEKEKELVLIDISSKKREISRLEKTLKDNEAFKKNVDSLNLVINHNGEEIPIDAKNLVGYSLQKSIISLTINDLNIDLNFLLAKKLKIEEEIKDLSFTNESTKLKDEVDGIFAKIGTINVEEKRIQQILDLNREKIKMNIETMKEEINTLYDDFWIILEKVLKKIDISNEYITPKIVTTDSLIGITGTQLHKLTFSYKIALTLYVKETLGITLPFIIDSPRSGEISSEVSSQMINTCYDFLKDHQLIISSVYSDYDTKFDFSKIILENGVVSELEKFIYY